MSEKFLNAAADAETSSHTYSQRRKQELRKQQQRGYIKSRRELEEEARELGLQKQIGEDNKGMKMLMKMGFKYSSFFVYYFSLSASFKKMQAILNINYIPFLFLQQWHDTRRNYQREWPEGSNCS